ncbi:lysine 5,6-aminomutase subunit alpha TIM-barrel domain-containing protein [Actinomadura luteofluorescens]|uniref:lysine 5,6-aminomutase subunit alpha TIM-barrel domain-containing protein n=1 Tax=Actinomadura luteofluorescens TaxID=46163 RepID=UPI003634E3AE
MAPQGKLDLDPEAVRTARRLAARAAEPIIDMARSHTTVSVERALLRLAGLTGADDEGRPWANHLADAVRGQVGLEHGLALPVWDALLTGSHGSLDDLARAAARGGCRSGSRPAPTPSTPARPRARRPAAAWRASTGAVPSATGCWPSCPPPTGPTRPGRWST